MPFTKNFRTPGQLTGIARGAFDAEFERFRVSGLLPAVENFTLDYSFNVGSAPLPPAAKFRAFNAESMVNRLGTGQTAKGSLPPTSIRMHVDEYTQLKLMGQDDAIGQKFEQYAIANAQSIAFRIIIAAAQAIVDGKITLAERGLQLDIDFGRKAGLKANAATVWSNTAASLPISDLEALRNVLGKRVSQTILSRVTLGYLQRNVDLMKLILGKGSDLPSRVSSDDVISFLGSEGFGQVVVDEDTVPDTTGTEVPLFAADKVILISGSQVGTTEIGVTTEAIESENGIGNSDAPGLFSGAIASSDPSGYDVYVGGILLPTLTSPDNTAVLDAF
ncbi:major capsid protein [Microbacterium trichothecenolyticum]|uniref:Phage major capsid protein E n=1 Tax=Microbacterium trichothecenolyticum TaxID=69370 RepID=A0A0M2H7J7_MICTR|nr:major capsid protein [Microbacterium trichothecenolyticum]KJL39914.1 Phage major capsid protein E [Microbacterium trichothecenolyticum]